MNFIVYKLYFKEVFKKKGSFISFKAWETKEIIMPFMKVEI